MPPEIYLHNHPEFEDLLRIVGKEKSINPSIVEKDYWIMHCLYGLQQMGLTFELKGGTSLSKGYQIILGRFSEDIDIHIHPPTAMDVKTGKNQDSSAQCKTRENFYDSLAKLIAIDGILAVTRAKEFDDEKFRSGGIRLHHPNTVGIITGLKEGVLLEAGFDVVAPNAPKDISSWAYDHASKITGLKDNRAKGILCYQPGYTFVEKLQAISTKYRKQQASGEFPENFLRHYYDVYHLLDQPEVLSFIGTEAYHDHKKNRFRRDDEPDLTKNGAFLLSNPDTRKEYEAVYNRNPALYYRAKPTFEEILTRIQKYADRL